MADIFRVKITGFDPIIKKVEQALSNTVRQTVMKNLGREARDLVYKRTKDGYGVSSDKDPDPIKVRLASLSPKYVKYRSKLAELGKFGRPGKSNLTLTGQLLDAIKVESRRNGFALEISKDLRKNSELSNEQVGEYVSENGRPFFALTLAEQTVLFRNLEKLLREELKRTLGRAVK